MKDPLDMTVAEFIKTVSDAGAGVGKLVGHEKNNDPIYAVIVLIGKETVQPVLDAMDELEKQWEESEL